MKKYIKVSSIILAGSLLIQGCTKDFPEINTDPLSSTSATYNPTYLLTASELTYTGSTDFSYETWRANLIYASTMNQGLSSVISYWVGDKYLLNSGYVGAYWEKAYPDQVKPVTELVQFTKGNDQYKNLYQIGRIMRALIMQRITDLYGDVPYFDAGLGYYTGNYFPKYDKQQDIYNDLLKDVEEATNALDPAADKPAGDVIYGGDIAKWQRLGNSLLLRMGMRLVKVDAAKAQAIATKVQNKTFTSNTDNFFLKHDATGGRPTVNRNSQILSGGGGQENYYVKWSKTFIDLLKTNADPRLGKIAVTKLYTDPGSKTQNLGFITTPAVQKGMPNGKDLSGIAGRDITTDPTFTSFPDYSSPHPGMIKLDGPTFLLTYAETELLLAEAAQRFGITGSGTAAQHYNNGVKAAMTITDVEADAYIATHPYVAANGLQMISTQYWIHTNTMLDFYESWTNWRRT